MFTSVILGAGKSTRMKANKSKLLFNIAGKPVINHIISSLKDAKSKSNLCVINKDSSGIKKILDEEKVNPDSVIALTANPFDCFIEISFNLFDSNETG